MLLEMEEAVGRAWHHLVGHAHSYPSHPEAAVRLEALQRQLVVFFRGLGGEPGITLAACGSRASGHRLGLRQRLGLGVERLSRPTLDGKTLLLPRQLDCFADAALNEQLYFWLVAFFANAPNSPGHAADPLLADLLSLRTAHHTTRAILIRWPGMRRSYRTLCAALLEIRPQRRLTGWEAALEEAVIGLLGGRPPPSKPGLAMLHAICDPQQTLDRFAAPRHYRPFLPVPLWGEIIAQQHTPMQEEDEEDRGGTGADSEDNTRRNAKRRKCDQSGREDSLILSRFDTLLCLAELVNVNRSVDDDDKDAARRAAEELDEITFSQTRLPATTKLKFDLDLAPDAVATSSLSGRFRYPEWDYRRASHYHDHCRVVTEFAAEEGEDWHPDESAKRRIRQITRQFEALRPKRQVFPAQPDGDELDLAALVRTYADHRAGQPGSERIYSQARNEMRDLAVAVLMDISLSTDSWVDNHRVLDVEKEAVTALSYGLAACGDDHALFTFTSRKRNWVRVQTLKDFDEPLGGAVERRIAALKPGYYTRIGAALRHTASCLSKRANRHRLIILLTDGKPNDLDHYEGRYGVEDTRKAIQEARQQGLAVFGITVDRQARDYIPYLFGRGAYAIVGHITRLPTALPMIYRQLVG